MKLILFVVYLFNFGIYFIYLFSKSYLNLVYSFEVQTDSCHIHIGAYNYINE